jgi:uncharacterized protein
MDKSDPLLEYVKPVAKNMFQGTSGSHDWEHTLRVYRLCKRIGKAEGADMLVLLTAAYMHDIGRCFQDASHGKICHAEKGAQIALPIVKQLSLSEKQKKILYTV